MRLVMSQFMSLDGVTQAPGGAEEDTDGGFTHGGWSMPYFDPEVMGAFVDEGFGSGDALLFGRRTWEVMAGAWPERAEQGDPFAVRMNEIDKYVVSTTITDPGSVWVNSMPLDSRDAIASIAALKAERDGTLAMMGSSNLSTALVHAGLVDEYRLLLEPVILGGGKGIFPTDGELRPLELISTTTASTGVICCVYRPGVTPPIPEMGE